MLATAEADLGSCATWSEWYFASPLGIPGRKDAPSKESLRKRKGSGVKLLSLKSINDVLTVLHKLLALAQEQEYGT
ncbi:hypothetical protein [Pyxidicoccus trucidator]|uniref:hypothetical protein n=1 Tax=Pyxidicoccus trucidator TaxID=2709662 RepID=UPI001F081AB2|nr:hypothetical protein [Pyxidicoccus trucidator]